MNYNTTSLKGGANGKDVNNLNRCLIFLLINGAEIIDDSLVNPAISLNWLNNLIKQKIEQYGPVTKSLIQLFQKNQQMVDTGEVNQETAGKLNAVLNLVGAFDEQPHKVNGHALNGSVEQNGYQKIPGLDTGLHGKRILKKLEPLQQVPDFHATTKKSESVGDAATAHLVRLSIKNGEYTYAKADDIIMIESSDHLTHVHVAKEDKVKITLRNSCLKNFLLDLPKNYFLRVNRFCAVNVNRLSGGSYHQQFFEFDYSIKVKPRQPLSHAVFNAIGR